MTLSALAQDSVFPFYLWRVICNRTVATGSADKRLVMCQVLQ